MRHKHYSKELLHSYVDEQMDEIVEEVEEVDPPNVLLQEIQRRIFHDFIEYAYPDGITVPVALPSRSKRTEKSQLN